MKNLEGFVFKAIHDIRTPLTAVMGFAELLTMEKNLSADARSYAAMISEESSVMADLLENCAGLIKLKSNDYIINKTNFDIVPVVIDETNRYRSNTPLHRFAIDMSGDIKSGGLMIHGNTEMSGIVIHNLLSNAVKFSPRGGDVIIRIEKNTEAESAVISISDEGMGISGDCMPDIYDKFYQGDEALSSDIPGFGLGLAFVKCAVENHGGSITCESKKGEGSVFTVALPCHCVSINKPSLKKESENVNA